MRLLTLKTPLLALILSVLASVLIRAISLAAGFVLNPQTSVNLFDRALGAFYWLADTLTFLCLPRLYHKGRGSLMSAEMVPDLGALLQCYLIFFAGIGWYRHLHRSRHEVGPTDFSVERRAGATVVCRFRRLLPAALAARQLLAYAALCLRLFSHYRGARQFADLIKGVHDAAMGTGLFHKGTVKVRIHVCDHYTVGGTADDFVHTIAYIMVGRTEEQRANLSRQILLALQAQLPTVGILTVDIREINRATYSYPSPA
jgi:5-carboxymethyl-2-hydroxymuconate isomerase